MELKNLTCPTCLKQLEFPKNLYTPDSKDLLFLLNFLIGYEIKAIDGLFYICQNCEVILTQILNYKKSFHRSYETFCVRNNIDKEETISSNIVDPILDEIKKEDETNESIIESISIVDSFSNPTNIDLINGCQKSDSESSENEKLSTILRRQKRKRLRVKSNQKSEIDDSVNSSIDDNKKLADFLSDSSEYNPAGSDRDSDSDYEANKSRNAILRKRKTAKIRKKSTKNAEEKHDKPIIRRRRRITKPKPPPAPKGPKKPGWEYAGPSVQFPVQDVLNALADTTKYMTDIKNRTCIHCDYTASLGKLLTRHMKKHVDKYPLWCFRCNAQTENLEKHQQETKCSLNICKLCNKSFRKMGNLTDHLRTHSRAAFFVWDTNYDSDTIEDLQKQLITRPVSQVKRRKALYKNKDHNNSDSSKDKEQFENVDKIDKDPKLDKMRSSGKKRKIFSYCIKCKKCVRNLQEHKNRVHSKPEKPRQRIRGGKEKEKDKNPPEPVSLLCSICGKTYARNDALQSHMKYSHTGNIKEGEKPLKCEICGKCFGNTLNFEKHQKNHSKAKSHICHICGKGHKDKALLKSHLKSHDGEDHGPVYCSVCNKKFLRPALLELHTQKFHIDEEPFKCLICGSVVTRLSSLRQHMRNLHSQIEHKCKFCNNLFRSAEILKKHQLIHLGLKPYKCSVCPFSSRQSHGLTSHMKQHPEDLPQENFPHKCSMCYRRFSTRAMLQSHIAFNHVKDQTKES